MQSCYIANTDVHAIRQKLQLIIAAADGQNAPIIERTVKDIDRLLPNTKGEWLRSVAAKVAG